MWHKAIGCSPIKETPESFDERLKSAHAFGQSLVAATGMYVKAQQAMIEAVVMGVLADLTICLEGDSGVGKTWVARVVRRVLGISGIVTPLHPDLTAHSITGIEALNQKTGQWYIKHGPFGNGHLFTGLDELNRTNDSVYTALLDILNSRRIVIEGNIYRIPREHTTIAMMNPPGTRGTRPLSDALADRFDYCCYVPDTFESGTMEVLSAFCNPRAVQPHFVEEPGVIDPSNGQVVYPTSKVQDKIRSSRSIIRSVLASTPQDLKIAAP